jgi:phytoene synthase
LPNEYLREADVPLNAKGAAESPNLPKVCARLSRLAEKYFNEAETAMSLCNRRAMRPAKLMAASYRPLLAQLRAQNFDYAKGRVSLPKWQKLLLAARLYLP